MKTLIINADDFGLSREINAAIVRTHREGMLTSASLMVAEPHRDEAARLARENPALDVGLHAVVCKGRSVLPAADLAPAVDASGRFPENPVLAGMRWYFDKPARARLAAELRAQVEKHLELVGYLNHIDGHLNFHVHPVIADILVTLAVEYKVPCLRLPRERVFTTLRLRRDHAARKVVEAVIFRTLSRRTRRVMREHGLKSTDWLFGLHQSGHLDEEYVLAIIDRLRDGVTELYFHPAMDIGGTPPPATAQIEVEILTSSRVRDALAARGVRLTTFAELARGVPAS
ncbi:MAG TPA: hopanoid biosynthesis-associated protein HpnK [Candidatus Binataceae bacterium]|nr:hopanoid biosynthesis-associated protein HpnK [Candidatus Binataceae bacterium]